MPMVTGGREGLSERVASRAYASRLDRAEQVARRDADARRYEVVA